MKSEFAVFSVKIGEAAPDTTELNSFIRRNRIIQLDKQLVAFGGTAYWSFMIEYLPASSGSAAAGGSRTGINYRDILSAEDFPIYMKLKDLRMVIAEKEGTAVYTIFTNEQLAEIVRRKPSSLSALKEIRGIGDVKATNYGQAFLDEQSRAMGSGIDGKTS